MYRIQKMKISRSTELNECGHLPIRCTVTRQLCAENVELRYHRCRSKRLVQQLLLVLLSGEQKDQENSWKQYRTGYYEAQHQARNRGGKESVYGICEEIRWNCVQSYLLKCHNLTHLISKFFYGQRKKRQRKFKSWSE